MQNPTLLLEHEISLRYQFVLASVIRFLAHPAIFHHGFSAQIKIFTVRVLQEVHIHLQPAYTGDILPCGTAFRVVVYSVRLFPLALVELDSVLVGV